MIYEINICETVNLNHKVTLDIGHYTEREFDSILDIAQREHSLDDVLYYLRQEGCEVIKTIEDDGESQIDIDDMYEVE